MSARASSARTSTASGSAQAMISARVSSVSVVSAVWITTRPAVDATSYGLGVGYDLGQVSRLPGQVSLELARTNLDAGVDWRRGRRYRSRLASPCPWAAAPKAPRSTAWPTVSCRRAIMLMSTLSDNCFNRSLHKNEAPGAIPGAFLYCAQRFSARPEAGPSEPMADRSLPRRRCGRERRPPSCRAAPLTARPNRRRYGCNGRP